MPNENPIVVKQRNIIANSENNLAYANSGDAAVDLRSVDEVVIETGERRLIGTGLALSIPEGYYAEINSRSGLAAKHGIQVLNAPGIIDSGYRGEIKVILLNTDKNEDFTVKKGDRIAQMIVKKLDPVVFEVVSDLDETERGEGGFGSTGVN